MQKDETGSLSHQLCSSNCDQIALAEAHATPVTSVGWSGGICPLPPFRFSSTKHMPIVPAGVAGGTQKNLPHDPSGGQSLSRVVDGIWRHANPLVNVEDDAHCFLPTKPHQPTLACISSQKQDHDDGEAEL